MPILAPGAEVAFGLPPAAAHDLPPDVGAQRQGSSVPAPVVGAQVMCVKLGRASSSRGPGMLA